jgi:hypothetical protein
MICPIVADIRLQANASVTTRGKLDYLIQLHGGIFERLGQIQDAIKHLFPEHGEEPTG